MARKSFGHTDTHQHVILIFTHGDDHITDIRYSRHPIQIVDPQEVYSYHFDALAAMNPKHDLIAIVNDDEHTHPLVIADEVAFRTDDTLHMP
jgi:hypothetical protein